MAIVLAAVTTMAAPVAATPPPLGIGVVEPPLVGAEAWLLYDETADVILASHNTAERRPMASVTKLMTAIVALERTSLDDAVTVSTRAANTGEAGIELVAGEVWSMRELLHAMMVRSGNDAAVAVAEHAGGSVEAFVALMNAKAVELGLADTSFENPHGLDAEDHYTTALDLLELGRVAVADPVIERMVRTRVVKFRPDPTGALRRAVNTNRLLGNYPGVTGVKTGFTNDAGRVLVSMAERGDRRLFAVVMGAEDHFDDSRALLEYGFRTMGPADRLLSPLVTPQGGGGQAPLALELPGWLAVRLAAITPLLDGSSTRTAIFDTPLGRAIEARLRELVPEVVGAP